LPERAELEKSRAMCGSAHTRLPTRFILQVGQRESVSAQEVSRKYEKRYPMNIELSNAIVTPAIALLAGIFILVAPRFLSYIVAVYLIVVGIVGLIPLLQH
jgi:hypothetical protein